MNTYSFLAIFFALALTVVQAEEVSATVPRDDEVVQEIPRFVRDGPIGRVPPPPTKPIIAPTL